MACRILPKNSMLLPVSILLVADDTNLFMVIDILSLGVVVNTIVDFVGSLDEFFGIQLNIAGAYWASVASENVLGCHPELTMLLANDRDFIDSGCIIDFGEIVFVAVDGGSLPNELLGIAGNLLATNFTTTMWASDALQVIGGPLHKWSVLWTDYSYQRISIDIDRLGIVIKVTVHLLRCFYERFGGVAFILRTFGTSVALNVVACPNLEFAVFWTNNRHEFLGALIINLRVVIFVSEDFSCLADKIFRRARESAFWTTLAF